MMVSSPAQIESFNWSARRYNQEHPYLWLWLASGSILAHLVLVIVLRPWLVQLAIAPPATHSTITPIQLFDANSLPTEASDAARPAPPADGAASASDSGSKTAIAKSAPASTPPQTVILPEQITKNTPSATTEPVEIAKPSPAQTQERNITAPTSPQVLSPFPPAPDESESDFNSNSPLPTQGQPVSPPASPPPSPAPVTAPPSSTAPITESSTPTPSALPPASDFTVEQPGSLSEPTTPPLSSPSPIQSPTPAPTQPLRLPDVPTTYDTSQGLNTESVLPTDSTAVQNEAAPNAVVASVSASPMPITDTSRDVPDTNAAPLQSQDTFLLSDAQSPCQLTDPAAWQFMGQSVSAQVIVDLTGQAQIIPGTQQGTGNADYDQFAACLVEQHWQFTPATMDGQPVASDNLIVSITLNRN